MSTIWNDLARVWLETRRRDRSALHYTFSDKEIISPGVEMRVSLLWNAMYLNLHPTHYAVAIGPDGRVTNLKGGYNSLPAGKYILHYIDKLNRVSTIPHILERTLDGLQVSLDILIMYRVSDPIKAFEVQSPVDTLFAFIQSYLKEFIRSHQYNEIVGSSNGHSVDNNLVLRYIKDEHTGRNLLSKLFYIADIVVSFSEEKEKR